MKKLILSILLTALTALAASAAFAQTPGVTVTGTLRDAQGNPQAGTVTFTLSNHGSGPATVGGSYTITNDVTTATAASDGTFRVTLFGNYQIDQTHTYYALAFFAAGSSAATSTSRYQFNVAGTFDISTIVPYTGSPFGPVALPGVGVSSASANTWSQPQTFGTGCPTAASGINAQAVNGVVNAACFTGTDWVAKVNAAAAALPSQGGTVFVPASLSGGTSASGISLPAEVSLEFDHGTFTMGGALTINGAGHIIHGRSPDATILQFSGVSDGIYFPDALPSGKRTVIRDLSLVATNASGGKAFNAFDATTIPPTNIVMENVKITNSGSGKWAYGFYTSNMQFCSFRDITVTGQVTVGLHLENGTNENLWENVFVINAGQTRAAEITDGAINSSEDTFVGGGFQGSGSFYVHNSWIYMVGTHFEAITPAGTDTAGIIFDSANMRWSSVNGGGITTSIQNSTSVRATASQLGDVTVDSTSFGAITNSSYKSLTNSSRKLDLFGNQTFAGGQLTTAQVGDLGISNNTSSGQSIFSRLGTSAFAITQGTGSRVTMGSGFSLGFASSGVTSEDTYLSRQSSGTLGIGTTNGGIDGTLKLGSLSAGSIGGRCQASGTGTTAGIQECITSLGSQGGMIEVPAGTYTNTACIALGSGTPSLHIHGAGMTGVATAGTGTTIQNSTTDLFCSSGTSLHGIEIDGMVLDSEVGGGHIFNFSSVTGGLSQVHIHDVSLIQKNTAKSVLADVQAAGAGCIYGPFVIDNFIFNYAASNSVPAINIACDNPNGIVIDRFRANGSSTVSSYAIWVENVNTTSGGNGVQISNGVFEVPQAGAINLLSLTNPVVENVGNFDLSGGPTATLINVDKSATGGFLANSPRLTGIYSLGGTTSFPDVKINATNVYGGMVENSTLNWLDGGSAAAGTGRAVQVFNSRVNNKQNLASLESGLQTNGDLCFYNSSGAHSYCFYQTSAGVLFLKVDGSSTALSFNSSGQVTNNLTVTGNFNNSSATTTLGTLNFSHLLTSSTAPTVSSGFGTSPSITANNGAAAFEINVGTGGTATSGVIGLPTASSGWNCTCNDITTFSATVFACRQTASSTTSATIGNFNSSASAAAWAASDKVRVSCLAY